VTLPPHPPVLDLRRVPLPSRLLFVLAVRARPFLVRLPGRTQRLHVVAERIALWVERRHPGAAR
jgi:hypothetical protein